MQRLIGAVLGVLGTFWAIFYGTTLWAQYPAPGSACSLAGDQVASLLRPVLKLPIPVFIDAAFTDDQIAIIARTVDEWNRFSQYSFGVSFFSIRPQLKTELRRFPLGNAYCEAVNGSGHGLLIVRDEARADWSDSPSEHFQDADAYTIRCNAGTRAKRPDLLVVINTQLTPSSEQLQAVSLHELGHALGLNHSCTPMKGVPGYRSCARLEKTHPYYTAAMYPSLESGPAPGVYKTEPAANDLERLYCLYSRIIR